MCGMFVIVKYVIFYLKDCGGSIIIISLINGNWVFLGIGFFVYVFSKVG